MAISGLDSDDVPEEADDLHIERQLPGPRLTGGGMQAQNETAPVFSTDPAEEAQLRQETLRAVETLAAGGGVGSTSEVVANLLAMYERDVLYNKGVASHNELQRVKAELAEVKEHLESRGDLIKSWVRYGDRVRVRAQKWREDLAAALGIEPDDRGILPNVDELIEKAAEMRSTDNLTKAREARDNLLDLMYLYTDWKYVTKQLTTEEKELWADIIDAATVPGEEFIPVDRWWRK